MWEHQKLNFEQKMARPVLKQGDQRQGWRETHGAAVGRVTALVEGVKKGFGAMQ
jgi:hypothetical protein